mgnify:CR=1 FL=1
MKKYLVTVIMLFCMVSSASAQNSPQPEMILVQKNSLTEAQVKAAELQSTVDIYGKYAGLGKEVGTAINEGLKAVTTQTADFAKTSPGKLTMFIIAWKVIGIQFVQMIVGSILLAVGTAYFIYIFNKNCSRKVVDIKLSAKGKVLERKVDSPYEYTVIYVICYFVFIGGCCAIMFIH